MKVVILARVLDLALKSGLGQVEKIIVLVKKQGLAIVSTLNHVQRIAGHKKPR